MGRSKQQSRRDRAAAEAQQANEQMPRSFVVRLGKVPKQVKHLTQELRRVMLPLTAANLKERKNNSVRDFAAVAGPLGVSHLLVFGITDTHTTLRVAHMPRGPTLHFQMDGYTLGRDIAARSKTPYGASVEMLHPPLLVMSNMAGADAPRQVQLSAQMFQNMFPSISVESCELSKCRRVVLLHREVTQDEDGKSAEVYQLRHYAITVAHTGLARGVRKIMKGKIPDLSKFDDIADFLDAAGLSDSEAEEPPDARLELGQGQAAANLKVPKRTNTQAAVKLRELGPRLSMHLVKVTDGMCDGEVLYHAHVSKSAEEIEALRRKKNAQKAAKEAAKAKQAKALRDKKKGKKVGSEGDDDQDDDIWRKGTEVNAGGEEDDEAWFKREVGRLPTEDEKLSLRKNKATGSGEGNGEAEDGKNKKEKFKPWFAQRRADKKAARKDTPDVKRGSASGTGKRARGGGSKSAGGGKRQRR